MSSLRLLFRTLLFGRCCYCVLIGLCLTPPSALANPKIPGLSSQRLISGCSVYSAEGKLERQFPGILCLFLPDGRLISGDPKRLRMLRTDKSEAWVISGHYHHQLNWLEGKKSFLALTSKIIDLDGSPTRIDVLQKIDLDGKILAEIDSKNIYDQLKIKVSKIPFDWDVTADLKVSSELSHFNSFYEIPQQKKESKMKSIQKGNLIASSIRTGAVILSPDLKTTLERIEFPMSDDNSVHDVKITANGEVLFFNNLQKKFKRSSSIEAMDPVSKKSKYTFMASPPQMFYSKFCGGVQEIDSEHLLISHMTEGFFFLNRKTKAVDLSGSLSNKSTSLTVSFVQQVRAENIDEFLSRWLQ